MSEIEVPPYFLCPITLEIMKDPVTVSSGITYERESIAKWILSSKKKKRAICPVTKLPLSTPELTPNIILRRMIQSWVSFNPVEGFQKLPTPKSPVYKSHLLKLFNEARNNPQNRIQCLQKLRSIASFSEGNRKLMDVAGAGDFLESLIVGRALHLNGDDESENRVCEEALAIFCSLKLSESSLKSIINGEFIGSLTKIMKVGNYDSRAYSVILLESMFQVSNPDPSIYLNSDFFFELARILRDQISTKASRVTLKILITICPLGRNRIKAVESGIVKILIDLLLDSSENKACEMMLMVLDLLCQCADGRAHLLEHDGGLAVVCWKILRVPHVGSERAVRILYSVSKFSASPSVVAEMLQIGVVEKLCMILQVESGAKTKEKAREILVLHAKAWRNSSCIPRNLVSFYPS